MSDFFSNSIQICLHFGRVFRDGRLIEINSEKNESGIIHKNR